jgi:flagellar hook assembly protein FlgD
VRTLVNGPQKAGAHVQKWDGTDWGHRAVASGTYIYLIETSEFRAYRKLTLLR